MAAEQLDGASPSPSMDVYALAAVAFEMLTGEKARPETNPLALAHAISTQPPPDLRQAWPTAPPEAAEVLARGMSADPVKRPASAGELVRRLGAAFATERPTEAAPTPQAPTRQARSRQAPSPGRPPGSVVRPRPKIAGKRRGASILAPALFALAALAVAGVLVAALGPGGKNPGGTSSRGAAHAASPPSQSGPPASGGPSTATTPAGAVEQFYANAAQHRYAQAWALAGPSLRSQVGGYSGFQNLMSSVRSITFHRAQVVPGGDASTATVALRTTSVQTDRTQQCSGTARTVRSGGGWLVDGVSISCA
jgi:hypothetical protein